MRAHTSTHIDGTAGTVTIETRQNSHKVLEALLHSVKCIPMSVDIGDFGLSRKKMSDGQTEKNNQEFATENNENTDNKLDTVSKMLIFFNARRR